MGWLKDLFSKKEVVHESLCAESASLVDPGIGMMRPLGGGQDITDLSAENWRALATKSVQYYQQNAVGRRLVNILRDYVIGDGIRIQAKDEQVQELLDRHWSHSHNNWNENSENAVLELSLFGSQLWSVETDEATGTVLVNMMNPLEIIGLEFLKKNRRVVDKVLVEDFADHTRTVKPLPTVRERLVVEKIGTSDVEIASRRLKGDVFYFAINAPMGVDFGVGDLAPILTHIDHLDQIIINQAEKSRLANHFIWDISVEKSTTKQLDEIASLGAPKPGTNRVHDSKVTYNVVAPNLNHADNETGVRMLLRFILGGLGFPEHWYADGNTTNRATAQAMQTPTFQMLTRRQNFIQTMFEKLLDYQISEARRLGFLQDVENFDYSVIMPAINGVEIGESASALVTVSTALDKAEIAGWITSEQATTMFVEASESLGVDVPDAGDELPPEYKTDGGDLQNQARHGASERELMKQARELAKGVA